MSLLVAFKNYPSRMVLFMQCSECMVGHTGITGGAGRSGEARFKSAGRFCIAAAGRPLQPLPLDD